jgi:hypothetical protein
MAALFKAIDGHPEYGPGGVFHHWMPGAAAYDRMRSLFPGGYKLHVSADATEADWVAEAVLPVLRRSDCHHKIVSGPEQYHRMNGGRQRGKFITIYAGPVLHRFAEIVSVVDALLIERRFRPGPRPVRRLAAQPTLEDRIGLSGLLSYLTIADFTD